MTFTRRRFIAGIAAAFAYAAAGSAFAASQDVTIAVGGKALYYYLPLSIAEYNGYFKDEGLNVRIVDFQGGSKSLQAVIGGSADICSGAFEHTIKMQLRGQDMQAFVLQGRAPQVVFAVSNKTMPDFRTISDLKGKRIGVTAPGSNSNVIANFVLAHGGLKPSDVSFVGIGASSQAVAAIRSGQVDAFANLDPVVRILEKGNLLKIVGDTRNVEESDKIFGGPMVAGCLYAKTAYIKSHPDVIQGLTNAIVRANEWLASASAEDVVKVVPESYFMNDVQTYKDCFLKNRPALSRDGLFPEGAPEISFKALQSVDPKLQNAKPDLKAVYTNEYVKKALERYPTVK